MEQKPQTSISIPNIISRIGGIQTYILIYEVLNGKAYPDHREEDFSVVIKDVGEDLFLILYSEKESRNLDWAFCPSRLIKKIC